MAREPAADADTTTQPAPARESKIDEVLALLRREQGASLDELGNLAALSCLAPDIVTAIVERRQPQALTARTLLAIELPVSWQDQRALLGFA